MGRAGRGGEGRSARHFSYESPKTLNVVHGLFCFFLSNGSLDSFNLFPLCLSPCCHIVSVHSSIYCAWHWEVLWVSPRRNRHSVHLWKLPNLVSGSGYKINPTNPNTRQNMLHWRCKGPGGRPPSSADNSGGTGGWGVQMAEWEDWLPTEGLASPEIFLQWLIRRLQPFCLLQFQVPSPATQPPRWWLHCCCFPHWLASLVWQRDKHSTLGSARLLLCRRISMWIRCGKRLTSHLFYCLLLE